MNRIRFTAACLGACAAVALVGVSPRAYATLGQWGSNSVVFYVNPQTTDLSVGAVETAFTSALATWNNAGSGLNFVYGGRVSDTTTGYDNRNVAIFRPGDGSEVGRTYSWSYGFTMVDADIIFFDAPLAYFTGSSGCTSDFGYGVYLEDAATHELGHAVGLAHSAVETATMVMGYYPCSTWKRSLDPDDVAGIKSLYGSSSQAPPPPPAPSNTAPSVSIGSPSNNSTVTLGTSTTFSGSSSDAEEGNITSQLIWTSSIDGVIGYGNSFTRTLSAGTHSITASVTDSGGLMGARTINVTAKAVTTTTSTKPSKARNRK